MSTWIKGIGGYLPERVVTSEELEEMAGYKDHGVKIGLCKMLTGLRLPAIGRPRTSCAPTSPPAQGRSP